MDVSLLLLLLGCREDDKLDILAWPVDFKCCLERTHIRVHLLEEGLQGGEDSRLQRSPRHVGLAMLNLMIGVVEVDRCKLRALARWWRSQ